MKKIDMKKQRWVLTITLLLPFVLMGGGCSHEDTAAVSSQPPLLQDQRKVLESVKGIELQLKDSAAKNRQLIDEQGR